MDEDALLDQTAPPGADQPQAQRAEASAAEPPRQPAAEQLEPPAARRPPPAGARCDACHERGGARTRRTNDGLLAVCAACARGVDVSVGDSTEAIAALALRAPAGERRVLTRRLLARRAMHSARRERRQRPPRAIDGPPLLQD